jgi:D-glycero-alpha-D-manno-heptose-7-phosphate kinase
VRNLSSTESAEAIEAMHRVKAEALQMKESLLRGDFRRFVDAINTGWESKRRTASNISNDRIDELSTIAAEAGARGVKVSGAGGGGFLMFFVDPASRMRVIRAVEAAGAQTTTCHFTKHGTEGWKIY